MLGNERKITTHHELLVFPGCATFISSDKILLFRDVKTLQAPHKNFSQKNLEFSVASTFLAEIYERLNKQGRHHLCRVSFLISGTVMTAQINTSHHIYYLKFSNVSAKSSRDLFRYKSDTIHYQGTHCLNVFGGGTLPSPYLLVSCLGDVLGLKSVLSERHSLLPSIIVPCSYNCCRIGCSWWLGGCSPLSSTTLPLSHR